jgi:CubicO group peptidase (beta-lactamase class C family)
MSPLPDANVLADALLVATAAGSTVVLAAGSLAGRREFSGHVRRLFLSSAMLATLGGFAVTIAVPSGPIGCLAAPCAGDPEAAAGSGRVQLHNTALAAGKFADLGEASPPAAAAGSRTKAAPGSRLLRFAVLVWLVGVALALARIARRHWLAGRFVRQAEPVADSALEARFASVAARFRIRSRVRLLQHAAVTSPVIAGTWRPALLLPAPSDLPLQGAAAPADIVFLHELSHVRHRDPLVTLLCELAAACFWFNPLFRRAARQVRELQEIAADSQVLREGIKPSAYASYLLAAIRREGRSSAFPLNATHSIAGDCLMETRLRTILDPGARHGTPRPGVGVAIGAGSVALCAALAFAPAALQARGLLTQESPREPGLAASRLNPDSLDAILRPAFIDHMADRYIAGAAVAVVHGGEVVYQQGFGRREVFHEDPVDVERTIWRIGSITKVLTGVAVMQLVDRGLLDLDADVNVYLTDLRVPDTFAEPVRVRHLLTHTAGFDQVGLGRHVSNRAEVRPLADFLAEFLSRIRPPGVLSTYDTYGITLAGHLVERVSGLPYEEYLRRHVFAPLDMHRSGIVIPPALEEDVAVGYSFAGHWEAEPWEFMNTDPASTVNASVPDMANVAIMLLNEGRFRGRQVLSAASARAMLTRQFTNHPDQPGYGYTLWEDRSHGVPAFSHGGSMTGFASFLYLVPEHDLGVFVAYNQESGSLAERAVSTIVAALLPGPREFPDLRERLGRHVDSAPFVGTYANSMHHHADPDTGWRRSPFRLEADEEGRLVFQGAPAFPVGELAFQREDGLLLTFLTGERGQVSHLVVNQTVYERLR